MSSKKAKFASLVSSEATEKKPKTPKEQVIENLTVNTGIQETVNTDNNKAVNKVKDTKKVTYELDKDLCKELKIYATMNDKNMVDVVEAAIKAYIRND